MEIITKSAKETQQIAREFARALARAPKKRRGATVVALEGELGAGKTTFAQGFARALGVKEKIKSPTFVLMKAYDIPSKPQSPIQSGTSSKFKRLIHIDCYRIHSSRDLLALGIRDILKNPHAVILIEWPERVKKIIPRDAVWLKFAHGAKPHQRIIAISQHPSGSQILV